MNTNEAKRIIRELAIVAISNADQFDDEDKITACCDDFEDGIARGIHELDTASDVLGGAGQVTAYAESVMREWLESCDKGE